MYNFYIIGIPDKMEVSLSAEVKEVLKSQRYFSGGKRHRDLVAKYLPKNAQWIDIAVPLEGTFKAYEKIDEPIVVIASGDPLFFGIGNTIKRRFPEAKMKVYSYFNSLQLLAQEFQLAYGEMCICTLTGRDWVNLDQELIRGKKVIGVLTDKKKTPSTIAKRMLDVGFDNYKMIVGAKLGGEDQYCTELSLDEAINRDFSHPNCLILIQQRAIKRTLGIHEKDFYILNGRPKMITKRSIRLNSISFLNLNEAKHLWDVGYCTGSISIEAKQYAPHLQVTAFERREESKGLLKLNQRKFCVPGIVGIHNDFFNIDLAEIDRPDRIFIGGHGGRLAEMMRKLHAVIENNGIIVFNTVSESTKQDFLNAVKDLKMEISDQMSIQQDNHNPIVIFQAKKIVQNI
ncbi:precorrin-6y C5,15-methyltransferase (decarboxylating) subunit CbiE [Marinifilum sp. RC60d5]|uniref:precorrin-6y C5,15-methyltransferase (decarboxylating) subunit CbiE n=1 Tax=Marinifilum sp. RC60d5 TaxID=3458414 RepID=UPI0040368D5B